MSAREEVVERLYNEGWRQGDFDVVFELIDPGVVWTAVEDAPDAGTYRGHEGVRGYMQDGLDAFEPGGWQIEESIEVGDRLVCVHRVHGTGRGSRVAGDFQYSCVYRFGDDNRILQVNEFLTRDEAIAVAERWTR